MTTEIATKPKPVTGFLQTITDETIDHMADRFKSLKVNGLADKKGYELVKAAARECVKARSAIAKEHKELKEESLRTGQMLDAEKRRLTAKVDAIEVCLEAELQAVKLEEERIQKEKDDDAYAIRLQLLTAAGGSMPEELIRSMSEHKFNTAVEEATVATQKRKEAEAAAAIAEAERKRIAAEEAEANRKESIRLAAERAEFEKQRAEQEAERKRLQEIEDQRLAKERAELESQRQEQARQAAELKAEQDRLARAESERLRAAEQERIAAEAAERARLETEARLKREAEVAERERIAKEAAEKRALELRPAKQKLNVFAHSLIELEIPNISDLVNSQVQAVLNQAAESIRRIGANLS